MSPLAKQVIDVLTKEEDSNLLSEVLDFYEYLKQKQRKQLDIKWQEIEEDEASDDEIKIINEYERNEDKDMISLDTLVKELSLDE